LLRRKTYLPLTISFVLGEAVQQGARLEAEVLLSEVLKVTRSYLLAWPEKTLTAHQYQTYRALLARRIKGEPLAYLLGRKEFWSLELKVNAATLIPRPETELLVELVLAYLPGCRVLDLGTGSGAIALAIAKERPQWQLLATDNSWSALQVARWNAQRLGIMNVEFLLSDWCAHLGSRQLEVIVANPPYIAEGDAHLEEVRYEPRSALVGGADGLVAIREIIRCARSHLVPRGSLLVEHGYNQGALVRGLFEQAGYLAVRSYLDLAGLERVTGGLCGRTLLRSEGYSCQ